MRQPVGGRLVLSIVLNSAGEVEFAQVTSATTEHLILREPIESLVRSMQFGPAPGEGYFIFSYPLTFVPH